MRGDTGMTVRRAPQEAEPTPPSGRTQASVTSSGRTLAPVRIDATPKAVVRARPAPERVPWRTRGLESTLSGGNVRSTLGYVIGSPKATVAGRAGGETGMRRVSWVRIVVDDRGARCQVLGVGHRLPSARRVSLETALALAAKGVPTVVRTTDGPPKSC